MKLSFAPFLLATVLADCTYSTRPGDFEITIVKPSNAKRDLSSCGKPGILTISLTNGVLTDTNGRIGYINSGHQFQFDKPAAIQGALAESGFSICNNGSLSLGTTDFYQCLVLGFYNLYTEPINNACELVNIDILPCDGKPAVATTTSTTASTTATSSTTSSTAASTTASITNTTSTTSSTTKSSSSIVVITSTTSSILSYTHTSTSLSSGFISTGVVNYSTVNSTYQIPSTVPTGGSGTGTPTTTTTAVHTGGASLKYVPAGLMGFVALLYIL